MSATKISRIHKELNRLRADFQADSLKLIAELMELCQLTTAELETYMRRAGAGRKKAAAASVDAARQVQPRGVSKAATGAKSPKPGNYRRGPQPAKYRNPKTGETWSGLARPPAWIANVKDRSKFLIEH